jgi:hypothetical protein
MSFHAVQQKGTDEFVRIGEHVTESLERRPVSLVVIPTHKPNVGRRRHTEPIERLRRAQSTPVQDGDRGTLESGGTDISQPPVSA